jgi:hypothetical protein
MIIPTLGRGALYRVHRERYVMLTRMEKRKAFIQVCGIVLCAGIVALIWILK